jgi:hypothetical protein
LTLQVGVGHGLVKRPPFADKTIGESSSTTSPSNTQPRGKRSSTPSNRRIRVPLREINRPRTVSANSSESVRLGLERPIGMVEWF